jgi:hypothetical protein
MLSALGDIQELIDEGLSIEEVEVEMSGSIANAISEAAELITNTYIVLYSNDFDIEDYYAG